MPAYKAITKTDFADLRWKRFDSYAFAAQDAVAPLAAQELARACTCLPIAFIQQSGAFVPVAVLGLQPGRNLFIAPDGRWSGPYVPAAYRGHPFALAEAENDQLVLCIDMDSGLVGEHFEQPFFEADGEPAKAISDVLEFLRQVRNNHQLTQRVCAALHAEGLIVPWPLTLRDDSGEQMIQGLYRIDESALNTLDSETLARIHQAGALPVAYCQLLSMQHIQMLGKLAEAHRKLSTALPINDKGELDLEFLNDDTISFSKL